MPTEHPLADWLGHSWCHCCGQMLSAVSGLSLVVGCAISCLGLGVVVTFGIGLIHTYERYAYPPFFFIED